MKTSLKMIAASLALVAGQASASPITVAGVTWDPDSFFDFRTTDFMIEQIVTTPGDTLHGYGKIGTINGLSNFCAGCELTYEFSFTLSTVLPGRFVFSGGSVNVYSDSTPNFDPLSANSAADGTLFLSLSGHSHVDILSGLTGTLFSDATPTLAGVDGFGRGLFDVTGGAAAGNFDTNTRSAFQGANPPDFADFSFTSSFQLLESPFMSDDGRVYTMFGSNDFRGNSIPEPGSMALLGLGLVGLGALRRRKIAQ